MMLASTTAAAVKSVQVVTVPTDAAGVADGGLLPPAGTVVIYVGDAAAPEWHRLRAAALDGDWQAVRDTAVPQHPNPGAELTAASTPFDLVCAGHVVAHGLALPHGVPFRTLTFPYTGGPIQDADFGIVEHTDGGTPAVRTTCLLMRRAPELTRLERQLLDDMDPEERHVHMRRPQPCQTLTAMDALTDGIGRAAQEAVREKHARGGYARDESATALSQSEITEIAGEAGEPAAAVADLLATRRRHFSY